MDDKDLPHFLGECKESMTDEGFSAGERTLVLVYLKLPPCGEMFCMHHFTMRIRLNYFIYLHVHRSWNVWHWCGDKMWWELTIKVRQYIWNGSLHEAVATKEAISSSNIMCGSYSMPKGGRYVLIFAQDILSQTFLKIGFIFSLGSWVLPLSPSIFKNVWQPLQPFEVVQIYLLQVSIKKPSAWNATTIKWIQ